MLKSAVEDSILNNDLNAIFRLSKVFSLSTPLLRSWRKSLENGESIFPFFDLRVSPITYQYVVKALFNWVVSTEKYNQQKVIHLSASSDMSYSELAMQLAVSIKADTNHVMPRSHTTLANPLLFHPEKAYLECTLPLSPRIGITEVLHSILSE